MPKVSIITPCYNSEHFVDKTIQSVRQQTFTDWELIVVNDGSTDQSLKVIQSFAAKDARIRIVDQANRGMIGARLSGFEAVSPDSSYLLFLDADDCAEPLMLERLTKYLDTHSEVGMVYCDYQFIDEHDRLTQYPEFKPRFVPGGLWFRTLPPSHAETPFVSVFNLCVIISSISMMRRSVYEKVGGYDPDFGTHREDTDLFLRFALRSKIHFCPEKLIRRRRHMGQDTTESDAFRQKSASQTQKLYTKWRKEMDLTPEERKTVEAAWRFKQGRVEPYQAFLRARNFVNQGHLVKAARFYLGGVRLYLTSLIPGAQL